MSKIRVHELAKELGRQNKEVIEFLKAKGLDIKSHMSNIEEEYAAMAKEKFSNMGKEPNTKLETPKTEEKTEQPKKKEILSAYITRRMQATAEREEDLREKESLRVRHSPEAVRQHPHVRRSPQQIRVRHSRIRRRDPSR